MKAAHTWSLSTREKRNEDVGKGVAQAEYIHSPSEQWQLVKLLVILIYMGWVHSVYQCIFESGTATENNDNNGYNSHQPERMLAFFALPYWLTYYLCVYRGCLKRWSQKKSRVTHIKAS